MPDDITVVVTGGRKYSDVVTLYRELDFLHAAHPIGLLVEGGQTGADTLAREWAKYRHVEAVTVPADWERYGPAAGPIRNGAMLDYRPKFVIAFPGGEGTANCVKQARARGITVLEVGRPSTWGPAALALRAHGRER